MADVVSVPEATSHTPGPWSADKLSGYIFTEGEPYGAGQMMVAMVRGWGHLTGTGGGCAFNEDKAIAIQEANARLMAAAPELLAALNMFLDVNAGYVETLEAAIAAVAKAEGR